MPTDDANTTISFRLPSPLHDEVQRLAALAGITKHQLARTLITQALESGERARTDGDLAGIENAFQHLQDSIADLRLALGRGIGAILQDVAPRRNKEQIRRWIFERIITPSHRSESGGDDES